MIMTCCDLSLTNNQRKKYLVSHKKLLHPAWWTVLALRFTTEFYQPTSYGFISKLLTSWVLLTGPAPSALLVTLCFAPTWWSSMNAVTKNALWHWISALTKRWVWEARGPELLASCSDSSFCKEINVMALCK